VVEPDQETLGQLQKGNLPHASQRVDVQGSVKSKAVFDTGLVLHRSVPSEFINEKAIQVPRSQCNYAVVQAVESRNAR